MKLTTLRDPAYDLEDARQDGALEAWVRGKGIGFAKRFASLRFIDHCRRYTRLMEILQGLNLRPRKYRKRAA